MTCACAQHRGKVDATGGEYSSTSFTLSITFPCWAGLWELERWRDLSTDPAIINVSGRYCNTEAFWLLWSGTQQIRVMAGGFCFGLHITTTVLDSVLASSPRISQQSVDDDPGRSSPPVSQSLKVHHSRPLDPITISCSAAFLIVQGMYVCMYLYLPPLSVPNQQTWHNINHPTITMLGRSV